MTSEASREDLPAKPSTLPPHIEDTVRAIAQMHAEHHLQSSAVERAIDRATALLGSAFFLVSLTLFVVLWVGINAILSLAGDMPFDPPPYSLLAGGLSLTALYMTALILVSQRRADRLASRREQMTLELSLFGEQKTAKIIELLEELRRDSPDVKDRIDDEASAMATPADTRAVHDAITGANEEMIATETADNIHDPWK